MAMRLIYSDNPGGCMPEHYGKVFAVIGPFDSHQDKLALQVALQRLVTEWNRHDRKARLAHEA